MDDDPFPMADEDEWALAQLFETEASREDEAVTQSKRARLDATHAEGAWAASDADSLRTDPGQTSSERAPVVATRGMAHASAIEADRTRPANGHAGEASLRAPTESSGAPAPWLRAEAATSAPHSRTLAWSPAAPLLASPSHPPSSTSSSQPPSQPSVASTAHAAPPLQHHSQPSHTAAPEQGTLARWARESSRFAMDIPVCTVAQIHGRLGMRDELSLELSLMDHSSSLPLAATVAPAWLSARLGGHSAVSLSKLLETHPSEARRLVMGLQDYLLDFVGSATLVRERGRTVVRGLTSATSKTPDMYQLLRATKERFRPEDEDEED